MRVKTHNSIHTQFNKTFSERIEKAINIAAKAHEGQYRRNLDKWPYVSHCYNVAFILNNSGFSEDVIIAGLFHDIVEDTDHDIKFVEQNFGIKVAKLVSAVTDPPNLSFKERKDHHCKRYMNAPSDIKAIKAADTLHNLYSKIFSERNKEDIWKIMGYSKEEFLKEYKIFIKALAHNWNHPIIKEINRYIKELENGH